MSTPVGEKEVYSRKRPRAQTNPPKKHTKSFAFRRFTSCLSSSPLGPGTASAAPTPAKTVPDEGPVSEPSKVESPAWEDEEAPTVGKDPELQKIFHQYLKPIKTEGYEWQKTNPSPSKPIMTDGTFDCASGYQEKGEDLKYLAPLFRSCRKSISPEDAEEVNELKLDQLWEQSISLTLNAVYCQHVAKHRIDEVFDELNRLIAGRNTLRGRITELEKHLEFEITQACEEKARTELEKIKVEQEKKGAVKEKVRADSLVAQVEESRKKISEELEVTKAALEEEKSNVSKLTAGVSAREIAAVEAFKQSTDFLNFKFEQFAAGYDDCRAVIQEHHPGLDLRWMDVEDEKV